MKHRSYSKLRFDIAGGQQNIPVKLYTNSIDVGVTLKLPLLHPVTLQKLEFLLQPNNFVEGIPVANVLMRAKDLNLTMNSTVDKLCAVYCVIYESRLLKKRIQLNFNSRDPKEAVDYAATQHNKYK